MSRHYARAINTLFDRINRRAQMVELSVLGGVVLRRGGQAVTGRPAQRHHVAILAFLAASPGCSASRDKLIGHLWPEYDSARARHRLSVAIHVLRRGLGSDCITASGDSVSLNRDAVWTDVGTFLDAVDAGKLEAAVGLYGGPFMDGFFLPDAIEYEPWMEAERVRLSGLYRAALERLIAESEKNDDLPAAVAWWRRLATHDRYSSSAAMGLMRALAAIGDLAGAVRHARSYATLVEGELELPSNPEVLELAEELVQASRANAAARAETDEHPEVGLIRRPLPALAVPAADDEPPTKYLPVVHHEPPLLPRVEPAKRTTRELALARRVAGWSAAGVLLTIVAATILTRGSATHAQVAPEPAVIVLPFAIDGDSPRLAALGQRVAEGVAENLGYVPNLDVHVETTASASADARGRRTGHRAEARWHVDATIRQEGSRTVATVQLVDARMEETTWSGEYDRSIADVERYPAEVALAIADDLRLRVAPYVPKVYTESRRAYDRFLLGVYAMRRTTTEDMWQALQFHREAWEEDPSFALAHAIAGNAYIELAERGVSPEISYENAREQVLTALALDSTLAEGHAALGKIQAWWDRDFDAGERSLRKAIMLYPTLPQARAWWGFYLLHVRHMPDEAIRQVRRALEVDPLNTGRSRAVELILYRARRYEEVEAQSQVTWSLDPEVAASLPDTPLGHAYRELGRYEDAVAEFQASQRRTEGPPPFGLAMTYARMGKREEAREILRTREARALEAGSAPLGIARVFASLDEPDSTFQWLNRTLELRPHLMLQITEDPALDPVRADPRFDRLLARLGLEPQGSSGAPLYAGGVTPGENGSR